MFERFTDRARRVVVLAQEEARLLNHNYIGTEHLLLAMLHEGEGIGAVVLEQQGVELRRARTAVEEIIGKGQQSPSGHIPMTPRFKKVMELSLRESLQLGNNYISTEHLLLGMIREGNGVGCQALVLYFHLDLSKVRQAVIYNVTGGTPANVPSAVEPPTTMTIDLTDDQALAFIAWSDNLVGLIGPIAGKHPLAQVRKALKARIRP